MNTDTPHPGSRWRCIRATLVFCLLLGGWLPLPAAEPVTFQYFYDDLGQLIKVVDSQGNVVEYVYDKVGNILETKRSQVGDLAIFDFAPKQGPVETTVTISGRGFSEDAASNTVQFNGVSATVAAASSSSITTEVPVGATTGQLAVTVEDKSALSSQNFVVINPPTITSVSPTTAVAGSRVPNFIVQGANLADTTFSFTPGPPVPTIVVNARTVDPAGTSATLRIFVQAGTSGQYVVVATNAAGSSGTTPSATNTITVIGGGTADSDGDELTDADEFLSGTDPLNPDTDGDEFPDGLEVVLGSSPLDPQSVPKPDSFITEAGGPPFSIENITNPGQSSPVTEAIGLVFSIENVTNPGQSSPVTEAVSPTFSVQNQP